LPIEYPCTAAAAACDCLPIEYPRTSAAATAAAAAAPFAGVPSPANDATSATTTE
jgi:hypothetical protein